MDRVTDYLPSARATDVLKRLKPLFLVGPTGSGKDTIVEELLKTGSFHRLVTYTTRAPRENHGQLEKEGKDYHFIDEKTALSMMDTQRFIEVAITHNNFYGTGLDDFELALKDNKTPTTDLDVKGVAAFKKLSPGCLAVFLLPPDFQTMQKRIERRYGSIRSKQDMINRLTSALFELEVLLNSDFYYVIVNEYIDATVESILQIVNDKYKKNRFSESSRTLVKQLIKDIEIALNDN